MRNLFVRLALSALSVSLFMNLASAAENRTEVACPAVAVKTADKDGTEGTEKIDDKKKTAESVNALKDDKEPKTK